MKKRNKQKQNKPKTLNDIYNSSNRYSMEMENVRFNYDDHLADYMKRNGRSGSDRVRSMNNSISMDMAHQESKGITATAKGKAPRSTPPVAEELTESVKRGFNKATNKFTTVAGGYLGTKFANWSWKHMVVAAAATSSALTVGLYSGYKKQRDE
ncbi:MAG: hypothetical protein QJT81_16390 [Candidatus Thiothrix putei]|uniref:Uncharacterized protein n=1 Tax=Candidatus Thiothrix putei TaxID=3080811 RepID=A0AA95HC81_9GAMM|nr:MAG: hypothetical protein QJT81_16390 [Candidatus Thiothrix putei]